MDRDNFTVAETTRPATQLRFSGDLNLQQHSSVHNCHLAQSVLMLVLYIEPVNLMLLMGCCKMRTDISFP
jgi:hypothetical protein